VTGVSTQVADTQQSLAADCGSGAVTTQLVAGAAACQSASAQSGSVQQTGARRRRDRRRGAVASPSNNAASDGAASGPPVVPFYGFSDEYVQARQNTANKAIRRIEIMINLLKSGSLSERQLNAILPLCMPT